PRSERSRCHGERQVAGCTMAKARTAHARRSGRTAIGRQLHALGDAALLRLDLDGNGPGLVAFCTRDLEHVVAGAAGEHVPSVGPAFEELFVPRADAADPDLTREKVDVPGVPDREREAAAVRGQLLDATLGRRFGRRD